MSKENLSNIPVKSTSSLLTDQETMDDDTPVDSSSQNSARSDGWQSSEQEQVRTLQSSEQEQIRTLLDSASIDCKKRDRRLAMNRVTARERRRRKKLHLDDLEREVDKLQATGESIKRENQLLRISIAKLTSSMRDGQTIHATPDASPLVQTLANPPLNLNHSLTQNVGTSTSNPIAIPTQLLMHQLNQARHTLAIQSTIQEIGQNRDALNSLLQQQAVTINNNVPLNPETNSTFNLQENPLSALIQQRIEQHQTNQSTLNMWGQEQNVTSISTPTTAGLSMGQNNQSLAGMLAQQRIQQLHQRIQPTLNQDSSTAGTQEQNNSLKSLEAKSNVPAPAPN